MGLCFGVCGALDVAKGTDVPMSLSLDRSRTGVFFFLWDLVIFSLVAISRWWLICWSSSLCMEMFGFEYFKCCDLSSRFRMMVTDC